MPVVPRHPPAVHYPFGPAHRVIWLLAALSVAGAMLDLAWLFLQQTGPLQQVLGGAVWAGSASVAWWWVWRMQAGELVWDGMQWRVSTRAKADQPCTSVHVCGDFQSGLWVRLDQSGGAPHWLWLEQKSHPGRWLDLRRALMARGDSSVAVAATAPHTAMPEIAS